MFVAMVRSGMKLALIPFTVADLGFLEGDFGNPGERSERAMMGSGFTGE